MVVHRGWPHTNDPRADPRVPNPEILRIRVVIQQRRPEHSRTRLQKSWMSGTLRVLPPADKTFPAETGP